ncbi:MAG: metal ABC transporter ATP-binding protein [Actinomycetota bacterium]|nr:metal ABC transporter ATP-binding protein [Actinomycetota bacterium]
MSSAALTSDPVDGDTGVPVLSLRDASFGYAGRTVVSGASLEVRRGEVVAVLGANGSGKSTIVRGVLGLIDQLGGDVALFGIPRRSFRDHNRVGYVPQRHTLSTSVRATAREIVATGRLGHQGWLGRTSRQDRLVIDRSLDLVGLADRATTDVSTLSGGQQRRVLIARALASEPEVLVMDEPTAGVDASNQHVLADVLARLVDRGVTMLIVTHEMEAFRDIVTRVVVVDLGRVTWKGPVDEFTAHASEILHEHHTHHHDDELGARGRQRGLPSSGPLDPPSHGTHREARRA